MPQTPEAKLFLERVSALPDGPGVTLDDILQPSLDDEAELRRLFATDKGNDRLKDIHVGLVDVFDAPAAIRTTRARVVKDDEDLSAKHIMPLSPDDRRKEGEPCTAPTLEDFKKNWAVFTEGSLSALPLGKNGWDNVVAAGGSVLACVTPVPEEATKSKRNMRKWYHSEKYPTSDVDLFLYGMTPEQAEVRINEIYEAVRDSVPWDVTCVRSKHTVSIHSQYPYRSVQIVLRLYSSPAEVLAGFDIDAPCVAYDGQTLWANPRSIVAMMRQANTVDMTRRSPSYEVRLCKYASRGYEVYVPTLRRADVDPTIYERAIGRTTGLARLLVLEKLATPEARTAFLESRRDLRGRPNQINHYRRNAKKYKGDLKQAKSFLDDLEMNDYDVTSLHIPYGPGWDARRIDKLVYQTDLGMNSPFNPKNKKRRLHRHPAFFGTMKECIEDCCEFCPDPIDDDEKELQTTEDEVYIRGRISFIEEDPGRQSMTGSFNPIDVGEWSEQAYIGPTEKFFAAIVAGNRELVKALIKEQEDLDAQERAEAEAKAAQEPASAEDQDTPTEKQISHKQRYVNRRDHVGRTALHLAILCKQEAIACDLIDAGIRITARIVDGRTALHLAAQVDQLGIIQKLLAKSKENEDAAIKAGRLEKEDVEMADESGDRVRDSSEDDWSSDDNDGDVDMTDPEDNDEDDEDDDDDDEDEDGRKKKSKKEKDSKDTEDTVQVEAPPEMPEDDEDLDILDINAPDWDLAFTPLHYAVLYGTMPVLEALLNAKADATLATKANSWNVLAFHPLTLTILRSDEPKLAMQIAERLIRAGAKSSAANDELMTIFHWAVSANQIRVVECILRCDEGASSVIDFPYINWNGIFFPIVTAISKGYYGMLAILLAYGAKISYTEEEVSEIKASAGKKAPNTYSKDGTLLSQVRHPVEVATANFDSVLELLVALGANCNAWIKSSFEYSSTTKKTVLDWIRGAIPWVDKKLEEEQKKPEKPISRESTPAAADQTAWQAHVAAYNASLEAVRNANQNQNQDDSAARIKALKEVKEYLVGMEKLLVSRGAKSVNDIEPGLKEYPANISFSKNEADREDTTEQNPYSQLRKHRYGDSPVAAHEKKLYDQLYEACFNGDNAKIEELCLPPKSGKPKSAPIQIAVTMVSPKNRWSKLGYTPLYAAISAGRWQTARLIMAIATAQYKPEEESDNEFTTKDIVLDSDDSDSECSDDSDMTVDQRDFEFVDIANRPSEVECDAHPKCLLDIVFEAVVDVDEKKTVNWVTLLQKAVYDGDIDAFKNIAGLYANLPDNDKTLDASLLPYILKRDRPDILDEYIRRTGYGIDIKLEKHKEGEGEEGEEGDHATNDQNRVYLGLNVHGKKRADLARKNDPNARNQDNQEIVPLVWQAAVQGASNIVEYLLEDKPYAAYHHYATTSHDERALKLRRYKDLEQKLPELLGWTINTLGESPLTAAIVVQNLDIVKLLYKKAPKLMSTSIKQRIKFIGFNPAQIAVFKNCEPGFIDFLLANGANLFEGDQSSRGNIFHYICELGFVELFEHLIKKLPREQVEYALVQPSKNRLNTPLHLAVNQGQIRIVELLLGFTQQGLAIRNLNGATPLHVAISNGFSKITQLLVSASPSELLVTENGVGETPTETSNLREIIWRTRDWFPNIKSQPSPLPYDSVNYRVDRPLFDVGEKEEAVTELRMTLDDLIAKGKLKLDDQRTKEWLGFVGRMERMVEVEKSKAKAKEEKKKEYETDTCDRKATLQVIQEASSKHQIPRQLVHLIDVQRVILGNIPQGGTLEVTEWRDELEPEEDEEEVEKRKSHIARFVNPALTNL